MDAENVVLCSGGCVRYGPNATKTIEIAGHGGVPATGVDAVILNVSIVNPATGGNLVGDPALGVSWRGAFGW
jgi:hypothetical protein